MHLKSLYLQNFRNYSERYFEFNSAINLICGLNARGKTTILEAIYYLMLGRSFRTNHLQDLIRTGQSQFFLETVFNKHSIDQSLRILNSNKERKIIHNSTFLSTLTSLLGLIQGIVMTPEDINLIKGSPFLRRQFMDLQIAQVDPVYVHYLTRYNKAMRQRNQLLKQKTSTSIELWEREMAHAASYIIRQRNQLIQKLITPTQAFYQYLTEENEHLMLIYQSSSPIEEEAKAVETFLKQKYEKHRGREMLLGYTLNGPHKDDLWIGIGQLEARFFASEGQQRSLVSALSIGSWSFLKEKTEILPIFMIDDVGMSLDQNRTKRLLEYLGRLGQVFLTATNENLLDKIAVDHSTIKLF